MLRCGAELGLLLALSGRRLGLDEAGKLGPLFGPPRNLPQEKAEIAQREEGWILGA